MTSTKIHGETEGTMLTILDALLSGPEHHAHFRAIERAERFAYCERRKPAEADSRLLGKSAAELAKMLGALVIGPVHNHYRWALAQAERLI